MIDIKNLEDSSVLVWEQGYRLLHTHRMHSKDIDQCKLIFDFYRPRGEILDVGCGFGTLAGYFYTWDQTLEFTLLNICKAQLERCPSWMNKVLGNGEELPFKDESFDCVMFNTSLLNMDRMKALGEARRVLRPRGRLLLSDAFIPDSKLVTYPASDMMREMHAHVTSSHQFEDDLYQAGFALRGEFRVAGHTSHLAPFGEAADRLFAPLAPILFTAVKSDRV